MIYNRYTQESIVHSQVVEAPPGHSQNTVYPIVFWDRTQALTEGRHPISQNRTPRSSQKE